MKQINIERIFLSVLVFAIAGCGGCRYFTGQKTRNPLTLVHTFSKDHKVTGEPFGITFLGGELYVSDGQNATILKAGSDAKFSIFARGFSTPSQIAADKNGNLIVADSGDNTIKMVDKAGKVSTIAGVSGKSGFKDGNANVALFRAPIGIAVFGERIFVADSYNDKIRVIENGKVSTIAGSERGFEDSKKGLEAKFDTPSGLAVWWDGRILIADTGNALLRAIDQNGVVSTVAGNGTKEIKDGDLLNAGFLQPTAVAVDKYGEIYVADSNVIRVIGRRFFPLVETLSGKKQGFADGNVRSSRFNHPGGLAIDNNGNVFVADSSNRLVRVIVSNNAKIGAELSSQEFDSFYLSPEEFRKASPPRWTYEPPETPRDIAGTLGEIRGKIAPQENAWFHNGLDIAGGYGETARFVRDEKVLRIVGATNFENVREALRMPTLGYIHIRLGRNSDGKIYDDSRFVFSYDKDGNISDVRVPRGSSFKAGEAIGTLNRYNHVHLIAGREAHEMNALDALILPGIKDTKVPTIDKVSLYDTNWNPLDNDIDTPQIKGKFRVVADAFDQMDGNPARRKLGVFKMGIQVLDKNDTPLKGYEDPIWNIVFEMMPDIDAIDFTYAEGSHSGATGETIFRYIVTNQVSGENFSERFLDCATLKPGNHKLRVLATDFFGNTAEKTLEFVCAD
ncbi:MAG: hypothetical protein ACK5NT_11580 [Pyrinomonadaceae bacterium]